MNWLQKIAQLPVVYQYLTDEDGEFNDNFHGQAWDLATKSPINILSDKEVSLVATLNNQVIGVLFSSMTNDKYGFDVVVDERFQNQGIGKELTDAGIQEYHNLDMPEVQMELDVVNPRMQNYLLTKGLQVRDRIGEDRVIMTQTEPGWGSS